jgi:hypothetical protein
LTGSWPNAGAEINRASHTEPSRGRYRLITTPLKGKVMPAGGGIMGSLARYVKLVLPHGYPMTFSRTMARVFKELSEVGV